jgi:hypothetical protein
VQAPTNQPGENIGRLSEHLPVQIEDRAAFLPPPPGDHADRLIASIGGSDRPKFKEGLKLSIHFSRAVSEFATIWNVMRLSSRRDVDGLVCLSFRSVVEGFYYIRSHEEPFFNKAVSI